jgi:hypothetical protein
MNKQLDIFLFALAMILFITAPVVAQDRQKLMMSDKNSINTAASHRIRAIQEIDKVIKQAESVASELSHKKVAAPTVGKLNKHILQLREQKIIIQNRDRKIAPDLKKVVPIISKIKSDMSMSDLGQKYGFDLQEANNIFSRSQQAIVDIISKTDDAEDDIIGNLK